MPASVVFPASQVHPGGALLAAGEKLQFELSTNSPAPIFSFKVDANLIHDASTVTPVSKGTVNTYKWDHPLTTPKAGEIDFISIAVVIVGKDDTYDYKISKKPVTGKAALLLQTHFEGPEAILRDSFNMVVAS